MDAKLREELTAWLEFYRELGIEDFYRREPGSVELPRSLAAARVAQPAVPPPPKEAPSLAESPRAAATSPLPKPVEPAPMVPPAPPPAVIRPPVPSLSLFEAPAAPRSGPETLAQIQGDLGDCHRCKLAGGRKTIVFGEGNPHAELVFIGEGPGADEDEQGRPFVGRAGKLLDRMIQGIGMKREEVYICNVVKCRPPGNRTPEKDEVEACSPFLFRQIEALQPRLICCLGAPAVRTVLGIKEGITKIRGHFFNFGSSKALATVHPAYILRNPREEKILREDFEKIREFLKGK
jgi:uracil-DNA glycosylase family 4